MRVPLTESASVKLGGTGAGVAKVGPLTAREVWYPEVASVSANANAVKESTCVVSVGDINTKRFLDSCTDGSAGDSTGNVTGGVVKKGSYVWAEWSGGDAGVTATVTVTGWKEV